MRARQAVFDRLEEAGVDIDVLRPRPDALRPLQQSSTWLRNMVAAGSEPRSNLDLAELSLSAVSDALNVQGPDILGHVDAAETLPATVDVERRGSAGRDR